jgi:NAD+--asparagine ADP-ribosyltransferase
MSRSYRKTPCTKDNKKSRKFWKRYSNHKIRHNELPSRKRGAFKRIETSYNIYDYITLFTKEEAIDFYNKYKNEKFFRKKYNSLEEFLSQWKKDFYWK